MAWKLTDKTFKKSPEEVRIQKQLAVLHSRITVLREGCGRFLQMQCDSTQDLDNIMSILRSELAPALKAKEELSKRWRNHKAAKMAA